MIFLWVIIPYIALSVMIVGSIFRFVYRPKGWGSKSSEILEKRWLRPGSLMFHFGMLAVIGGHVMGLVIPIQVYQFFHISSEFYHHVLADAIGGLAGLVTFIGCTILLMRRIFHRRVRRNSSVSDYVSLVLLWIVIGLGALQTVGYNNIVGPYEYRTTVGPWMRGIILLHPNPGLMHTVPAILQVHIVASFVLLASVPFTRLVHVWSAPVGYVGRPPVQYRRRHLRKNDEDRLNVR